LHLELLSRVGRGRDWHGLGGGESTRGEERYAACCEGSSEERGERERGGGGERDREDGREARGRLRQSACIKTRAESGALCLGSVRLGGERRETGGREARDWGKRGEILVKKKVDLGGKVLLVLKGDERPNEGVKAARHLPRRRFSCGLEGAGRSE